MKNTCGTFQGNYQYNRNSVLNSNLNKLAEGKNEKKKKKEIPKKAKGEKIKQMRETNYESDEIE